MYAYRTFRQFHFRNYTTSKLLIHDENVTVVDELFNLLLLLFERLTTIPKPILVHERKKLNKEFLNHFAKIDECKRNESEMFLVNCIRCCYFFTLLVSEVIQRSICLDNSYETMFMFIV